MGPENETVSDDSNDPELSINEHTSSNLIIHKNDNNETNDDDDEEDCQADYLIKSNYKNHHHSNHYRINGKLKNHPNNNNTTTTQIKMANTREKSHLINHYANNHSPEIDTETMMKSSLSRKSVNSKKSFSNGFNGNYNLTLLTNGDANNHHHHHHHHHFHCNNMKYEKHESSSNSLSNGEIRNSLIEQQDNHFPIREQPKHCPQVLSLEKTRNLHGRSNHHHLDTNNHHYLNKVNNSCNGTEIPSAKEVHNSTPDSKYNSFEKAPNYITFLCYVSYAVLFLFGYLRDFMRKTGLEKNLAAVERGREGFTPLYKSFESFYTRNIYRRIRDAWNRPIASVPGAEIDVVDRISKDENWTFEYPGTKTRVINMGSYNYLGYAENSGPIHTKVIDTIREHGVGLCSSRNELGQNEHVENLEKLMARFLGVESCVVFGMGFATNSTNIQCFVTKGCLILSDEHNHASLILGCKISGATTKVFEHNNMKDLEQKIRKYLTEGQPKSREPWKKIIILVEGIYSMEGTIVDLPELIRIKKKYKCYIYLDEAHSIGALGPNARGVIDYYGCDPNDVDILMGTFTKSFGAAGGYLAGRRNLVDLIRTNSFSHYYAVPMSPPVAQQIISVVLSLLGEDGTDEGAKRVKRLAYNCRYFRKELRQMGFIVYGHDDSPVVPLLLCFCSKIAAVIRMAHEKGLGFIGAGYPATSLTTGRVRFCISAAHTIEMLDRSLEVINEIGEQIGIKYSQKKQ